MTFIVVFFHPLMSISINVRMNMSFICQGVMNQFTSKGQPWSWMHWLCIYYIYKVGQKSLFCQRLNSSLVERWAVNPAIRVRIWVPPKLCSKNKDFFLIIEDKDYSKSRTKIGVSVDTKVWEIAQKLCGIKIIHSQIFDPLTDIWSIHRNFNSRCFKYVW